MTKGDRVHFTKRHAQYLEELHSSSRPRKLTTRWGTVVERRDVGRAKLVRVLWEGDLFPQTHFVDNLETP